MHRIVETAHDFQALLQKHRQITVLSHINPDPDAIGTALGVYSWLKEQNYQAEVVNFSEDIPHFLDFLPYFSKIKRKMDFEDSLIITCDCGSIDRVGFVTKERTIINIDHHLTNQQFGLLNIVDPRAVSSSQVAYALLKSLSPISQQSATAFYAALVSDTRNFTTSNMHQGIFDLASELVSLGVDMIEVSQKMLHRRSLASLRGLGVALGSLDLREDAQIAILTMSREDMHKTGARISDLDGVVDYAKSLTTVEVAVMLQERENGIKVSLRSKTVDISGVTTFFGGGGHSAAGGFEIKDIALDQLSSRIVEEIKKRGLIQ
jgi:phosphoesterase RecJ-like protein